MRSIGRFGTTTGESDVRREAVGGSGRSTDKEELRGSLRVVHPGYMRPVRRHGEHVLQ
jgi:hypothetical protein